MNDNLDDLRQRLSTEELENLSSSSFSHMAARAARQCLEAEAQIAQLQRDLEDLAHWRLEITVALNPVGGSAYADVPKTIRGLRRDLDAAQAEVWRLQQRDDERSEELGRLMGAVESTGCVAVVRGALTTTYTDPRILEQRQQFLDSHTKPLHVEIEKLREQVATLTANLAAERGARDKWVAFRSWLDGATAWRQCDGATIGKVIGAIDDLDAPTGTLQRLKDEATKPLRFEIERVTSERDALTRQIGAVLAYLDGLGGLAPFVSVLRAILDAPPPAPEGTRESTPAGTEFKGSTGKPSAGPVVSDDAVPSPQLPSRGALPGSDAQPAIERAAIERFVAAVQARTRELYPAKYAVEGDWERCRSQALDAELAKVRAEVKS